MTVVYGNTANGGATEFAIVLLNTSSVDASDFLFNQIQTQQHQTFGSNIGGDLFI